MILAPRRVKYDISYVTLITNVVSTCDLHTVYIQFVVRNIFKNIIQWLIKSVSEFREHFQGDVFTGITNRLKFSTKK